MKRLFFLILPLLFLLPSFTSAAVVNRSAVDSLRNGLVIYYSFDGKDVVNGRALDISGQGNHGILRSIATSTFYGSGRVGQGFNFDGVDDVVDAGDPAAALDNTTTITAGAWVKSRIANTGAIVIINKTRGASGFAGWNIIRATDDKFDFRVSDGATSATASSDTVFADTNWHHVVGVYNGVDVRIYVDGVLADSTPAAYTATIPTLNRSVCVGGAQANVTNCTGIAFDWPGTIDEVRIYNRALSATEVQQLYSQGVGKFNAAAKTSLATGLLGYWTFDGKDVVNGVVRDVSGQGNHGNPRNIATSTFYKAAKIGQGGHFTPLTTAVKIPNNIADNIPQLSVSLWVKSNVTTNPGYAISKARASAQTTGAWELVRSAAGAWTFIIANEDGTQTISATKGTYNNTQWQHVVGTYDGTNIQIYVDAVAGTGAASTTAGNVHSAPSYPVCIGNINGDSGGTCASNGFNGLIDEVRIYSRGLSQDEVDQLYAQGQAKFNVSPVDALKNGLVGYWNFDGKTIVNGVVRDQSGNGNGGNPKNIATSSFYTAGKIGQAGKFDGVDDYVNVKTISSGEALDLTGDSFTMSAWVKIPASSHVKGIFMYGDAFASHVTGLGTRISSGQQKFEAALWRGTNLDLATLCNTTLAFNTWHHLVETWDGTNVRGYLNGTLCVTSADTSSDYDFSGATVSIGTRRANNTTDVVGATIDDARIYNRALSATEILLLYNLTK